MKLDDLLKDSGILCAFVATEDGFLVESTSNVDLDPEEVAALAATATMRLKNTMNLIVGEKISEEENIEIIAVCGHSMALKELEGGIIIGILYDSNEIPTGQVKLILQRLSDKYRNENVGELLVEE